MITAKDVESNGTITADKITAGTISVDKIQDKYYMVEIGIGTSGVANRLDACTIDEVQEMIAWLDTKKWFKPRYLKINHKNGGTVLDRKVITYINYKER